MVHEQVNLETFLAEPGLRGAPRGVREAAPPEVVREGTFSHPLIKPNAVETRAYQVDLADAAMRERTLVVLPTGLGKTIIALITAARTLHESGGKVLFLAPTRPLVQQHAATFRELLRVPAQLALSGSMAGKKRAKLWSGARVIFSTPQGLQNDLEAKLIDLAKVELLIFDEAHRAVGDYDYVDIAKRYLDANPAGRVLGLTASPGGEALRVEEVVRNLGIERVEGRDETSPDVAPYVKDISVRWVRVPLTAPMQQIRKHLDAVVNERAHALRRARYLPTRPFVGRKDVLEAGNKLRGALARGGNKGALFGMLLNQGVVMQALHCLELLETQGVEPLRLYLERLFKNPETRAAKAFIKDARVVDVLSRVAEWRAPSHPKIAALVTALRKEMKEVPDGLVIVFAQYRDTIASIVRALDVAGISAEKFVGQADREGDDGMSQDEQREALERLRARKFRVLVASSVAEEGLDIPRVDLVVFYEPVPSEIRLIQRRGRTGRQTIGRVVVLMAEGTRDEAFMHAGMSREKKMRKIVKKMGH